MSVTVPLNKPITAHGEQVSELTFRELTVDDVMQLGSPQLLMPSADGNAVCIEIRAGVIGKYIMRLAQIPLGSVKALSIADFQRCQNVIMDFFTAGDGETDPVLQTESSTSPTSGE